MRVLIKNVQGEKMFVSFNKPPYIGKESEYVLDAVNKGHISGDGGPFIRYKTGR